VRRRSALRLYSKTDISIIDGQQGVPPAAAVPCTTPASRPPKGGLLTKQEDLLKIESISFRTVRSPPLGGREAGVVQGTVAAGDTSSKKI